jgi:hypothetical protein
MYGTSDVDTEASGNDTPSEPSDFAGLPLIEQDEGRHSNPLPNAEALDSFLEAVVDKYGLMSGGAFDQLVVTAEGVDARMFEAFIKVNAAGMLFCHGVQVEEGANAVAVRYEEFLNVVCKERLRSFVQAAGLDNDHNKGVSAAARRLIETYRKRKIAILRRRKS